MTTPELPATPALRRKQGFVLLAVLILVGLIALVGATYARHVTMANRSSSAAVTTMRAGATIDSGLQYARQMLRTGRPVTSGTLVEGSRTASVSISDAGGEHSRVQLRSTDSRGLGSSLLFEVARTPLTTSSAPDDLPRIRAATVAAMMSNAAVPKTWVSGLTTIQNTDLQGLLIVENGAILTLSGVTLRGCIVSETTVSTRDYGAYDVIDAPTVLIAGDLRVTPGIDLPGIAVVLPDGVLSQIVPTARLQFDGDVVAHSLVLTGTGTLHGNTAAAVAPSIGTGLQRPDSGRGPRAWAGDIELGPPCDFQVVATVSRLQVPADLPAILGFSFP